MTASNKMRQLQEAISYTTSTAAESKGKINILPSGRCYQSELIIIVIKAAVITDSCF